jgi:hypothetical protein
MHMSFVVTSGSNNTNHVTWLPGNIVRTMEAYVIYHTQNLTTRVNGHANATFTRKQTGTNSMKTWPNYRPQ